MCEGDDDSMCKWTIHISPPVVMSRYTLVKNRKESVKHACTTQDNGERYAKSHFQNRMGDPRSTLNRRISSGMCKECNSVVLKSKEC